jgi:hypothetical protein
MVLRELCFGKKGLKSVRAFAAAIGHDREFIPLGSFREDLRDGKRRWCSTTGNDF